MKPKILIYSDDRTATGSLRLALGDSFNNTIDIELINAADIHENVLDLEDCRILVLPGIFGEDSAYMDCLGNRGMHAITQFISRGNVLLTECAGSAYPAREIIYEPGAGPRGHWMNAAWIFNGIARGPVGPYGKTCDTTAQFSDVIIVPVRYKSINDTLMNTEICYANGPALYPDDPNDPTIEVICTYADIPGNPAAIIRQSVGMGAAYMSCILPDIAYQPIAPRPELQHARQLMETLKPHEAGRKMLWDDLMARIRRDLRL